MPEKRKAATEMTLKKLENEICETLQRHSLHAPHSVARLNQNDPNRDMIGYVMWEMDGPPSKWIAGWFVKNELTLFDTNLKKLSLAAEDFINLLELSLHGLGLSIFYAENNDHSLSSTQDAKFYHLISSFTALTIVSDRIRDLFILGVHRKPVKDFGIIPFTNHAV